MYEHYPVKGPVEQISDAEASKIMNEISPQWEFEKTKFGNLLLGVYNWDYKETPTKMVVLIPNLRGGGSIPLNQAATDKFGFKIYGDCFLKI